MEAEEYSLKRLCEIYGIPPELLGGQKPKSMIEIFEKYDTDKGSKGHNYAPYYEKHLPKTASKILEIGVDKGQSILMWHELFPEAHIYGLDLFEINPIPFREDWVTWFRGSQTDGKVLNDLRIHAPFDFIVEDGSHNSRDQLITFYGLVDCSPLYIVEDLHCCKEEFYRQGMNYYHTMLGQLKETKMNVVSIFEYNLYNEQIAFIYP